MFLKILFVLQLFLLLFNFATLNNQNEMISIIHLPVEGEPYYTKFLNMKLGKIDLNKKYRTLEINIELSDGIEMNNKFILYIQ